MSLQNRAIKAYRDSQVQDQEFQDEQASQFCDRAKRWLDKTFGTPVSSLESLAPDTAKQAIGWLDDAKVRVYDYYKELRLDVGANCPECRKLLWFGRCINLVGLGRTIVEGKNLVKLCGCQRKTQPEPTAEERLARAFTDLMLEVMDNR